MALLSAKYSAKYANDFLPQKKKKEKMSTCFGLKGIAKLLIEKWVTGLTVVKSF